MLIFFGVAVIVLGVWGVAFTREHIEREGISFGPIEDPAVAEHAPDWAGEERQFFEHVLLDHENDATAQRDHGARESQLDWPKRVG